VIRKHKDHLVLTPLGRRAAADPEVLARAVAAGLMTARDGFDQDAQAITVLLVAAGIDLAAGGPAPPGPDRAESLFRGMIARLLTDLGWRENDGPVGRKHLAGAWTVIQVLTPRLGRARGGGAPTSPAARHLARLALAV
jgi:hypothetical protein